MSCPNCSVALQILRESAISSIVTNEAVITKMLATVMANEDTLTDEEKRRVLNDTEFIRNSLYNIQETMAKLDNFITRKKK